MVSFARIIFILRCNYLGNYYTNKIVFSIMNTYWSKNLLQKFPLLGIMTKLIIPLTEKIYVQSGCQLIQFPKKPHLGLFKDLIGGINGFFRGNSKHLKIMRLFLKPMIWGTSTENFITWNMKYILYLQKTYFQRFQGCSRRRHWTRQVANIILVL